MSGRSSGMNAMEMSSARGDFQHKVHPRRPLGIRHGVGNAEQFFELGDVNHFRFDVDEQGQRRVNAGVDGAAERAPPTQHVQFAESVRRAGGRKQVVGPPEWAGRPPGQRLVGDDGAAVEVEDWLELAVYPPAGKDIVDAA